MIEGVGRRRGRLAVLLKVHHAAADGVTYANAAVAAVQRGIRPAAAGAGRRCRAPTGPLREALDGLARFANRPVHLVVTGAPATVRAVIDAIRRASAGRAMAAPFTAPRTPLNAKFTAQRNVAFARLDLDEVKKVKDHFGVKVNDVVMTLVGGAVRQFCSTAASCRTSSLVALVPVSVHGPLGSHRAQPGFGHAACGCRPRSRIPSNGCKPSRRRTRAAKEQISAIGPTLLQDWGEVIGRILLGIAKRVYAR